MGKTLPQLVAVVRQKSNTDGVAGGNQVVSDVELAGYINESVKALYDLLIGVDSSYYESPYSFTLASSATGNAAPLPPDFYKERGLVLFPDTERETPVFFVPFAERTRGKLGATLDGNSVRVYPWQLAGQGPWRLYYTPKCKTFDGDFQVRLVSGIGGPGDGTSGDTLPPALNSGPLSGVGFTLTATGNGALTVDSVAVNVGDRILVTNSDSNNQDPFSNGIYLCTNPGSTTSPWVLVRATDYDTVQEVVINSTVSAAAGAVGAGFLYKLTTFTFFPAPILYTLQPQPALDVTLDNFDEYITNRAAMMIYSKRQMDPGSIAGLFQMAEQRVKSMATMRIAEPEQAPVLWRSGRRYARYHDDLA
jgi:hypothetical protein